jgi:hypothetical protein
MSLKLNVEVVRKVSKKARKKPFLRLFTLKKLQKQSLGVNENERNGVTIAERKIWQPWIVYVSGKFSFKGCLLYINVYVFLCPHVMLGSC